MFDGLGESLQDAVEAAGRALVALVLALAILVTRALQAAFTLIRLALPVLAAALQVFGAVMLFNSMARAYGGDLSAMLLALASVVVLPVALVLRARENIDIWGILVASGALSLLAHLVIARSPPTLLGVLPGLGLSACIFYLTFGDKSNAREVNSER
jgi:hypothetical protein